MNDCLKFSYLDALIVEPFKAQAMVTERALNQLGIYSIRTARSGSEAINKMQQCKPTVVISSYYLPDGSGVDLVERIRQTSDLSNIAFILISSEHRNQQLEGIRQAGVCGILPKPFTFQELELALETSVEIMNDPDCTPNEFESWQLKVLLADDMPSSRAYIHKVLENSGINNIIEVENGMEAINLLDETAVDLIITDYNMPCVDGLELTKFIRSKSWQSSIPIFMVTSEGNLQRLDSVKKAGVTDLLSKPFTPEAIREKIKLAIHN